MTSTHAQTETDAETYTVADPFGPHHCGTVRRFGRHGWEARYGSGYTQLDGATPPTGGSTATTGRRSSGPTGCRSAPWSTSPVARSPPSPRPTPCPGRPQAVAQLVPALHVEAGRDRVAFRVS